MQVPHGIGNGSLPSALIPRIPAPLGHRLPRADLAGGGVMPLLLLRVTALVAAAVIGPAHPAELHPRAYVPSPVGTVTPAAWLADQLELQASGLSGHLSLFWNDIMNSMWIGGSGDGGLHERVPYWLNGVVPLSFLLANKQRAAAALLPGVRGIYRAARAPGLPDEVCAKDTDMPGYDIRGFRTASAATCRDACLRHESCWGFVVDACATPESSGVHCGLKSAIDAVKRNASCRCWGTVPPRPVNMTAQVERYVQYILSHQVRCGVLWDGEAKGTIWCAVRRSRQSLYCRSAGPLHEG